METHQLDVGCLVEQVLVQQAHGVADGAGVVAPVFQQIDQPLQRLPKAPAQLLAQGHEPVVIVAWQQIAGIEVNGFDQVALGSGFITGAHGRAKGRFKVGHIQSVGRIQSPLDGEIGGL